MYDYITQSIYEHCIPGTSNSRLFVT